MIENLILIFAYHFPPENTVGADRPVRFSKYLSRMGYTCRVFTAADQTGRDNTNVEYIPDPFLTQPSRGLGWQVERAVRKFFLPSEVGLRWSYLASRAASSYARAHLGARVTIFSTFPPLGTLLAGWQLARSEGFPWIVDFRDPISEKRFRNGTNLQKRIYPWLERAVARKADALIANTDAAKSGLLQRFPEFAGKIHSIWNGFDPEERILPLPVAAGDRRILTHTGELYDGRRVTPILESISRLIASGRLSSQRIRVRLIGSTSEGMLPDVEFLRRAHAEGWLDLITERIPRREALHAAQSSDSLLLLQPQSATQVPGKLFEYLQIGRPILAFVQRNSPAERLLERSGVPYRCIYPGDSPEAIDETIAGFFDLPSTAVLASPWFDERFNVEHQAHQLDEIVRSLHKEPIREKNPFPQRPAAQKASRFTNTQKVENRP
jgi:glycosyltransferase involved in cell wall biosynthesis